MNERERIGEILAGIREEKGYSLRELADRAGVSHNNIWKIEHGKYNVSIDILSKITTALDCSIEIVEK